MPTGIYKHKPCSKKTKEKISIANKGKKRSKIQKEKISKMTKIAVKKFWNNLQCRRKVKIRMRKLLIGKTGEKNYAWKGGRNKQSEGYIFIYMPNHPFAVNKKRYILEHRFVIEQQIGRYLFPKEQVHHLGEKDNNRPEMLMAFKNKLAHRRFELNRKFNQNDIIFDGRKL